MIWRFTTEDPVFYEVSLTKRPSQYFTDPQQWNTYSYVRNNPINLVDPTGEMTTSWWFQNTFNNLASQGYTDIHKDIQREGEAYKQASQQLLSALPISGDVNDAYIFARWQDIYTWEKVTWVSRWLAWGAMFIPGANKKGVEKWAEIWAQIASKSFYLKSVKGWRIDVENPLTRPWQIHLQVSGDKNKYMLNVNTSQFHIKTLAWQLAPKSIQRLLNNSEVQKGISKAKNILWVRK